MGPQWQGLNFRWYGGYKRVGNVIKNNILNAYGTGGADWGEGSETIYTDNTVLHNFCTDASSGRCVANGDPKFSNSSVAIFPPTRITPNLALRADSQAIDIGTYLTQAISSGTNSTMLVVADALYFQDGTWGSALAGHQADRIAIGSVGNVAAIAGIDYPSNTITLVQPASWRSGDRVWLYQKSDGARVL